MINMREEKKLSKLVDFLQATRRFCLKYFIIIVLKSANKKITFIFNYAYASL